MEPSTAVDVADAMVWPSQVIDGSATLLIVTFARWSGFRLGVALIPQSSARTCTDVLVSWSPMLMS